MAGIFKKNDIRGTFDENLTVDIVRKIGYIFGKIIGPNNEIIIAGDARLSTPLLKNEMMKGLVKAGLIVYDLGLGPSPMVYFTASTQNNIDQGIMITASHNPAPDNGIKICDDTGSSYHYDNLYNKIEQQLSKLSKNFEILETIDGGETRNGVKYKHQYFAYLKENFQFKTNLNIVVEFGNGAAGQFLDVLDHLGCEYYAIRKEPDGNFPTLLPDPTKEFTFDKIKEELNENNYDVGIAFDGDGDRVGFMKSTGQMISPDKATMLFAMDIINNYNHADILIDVKISKATSEFIKQNGGNVQLTQVGHSFVHEKLIETKSDLAAELSGHYYFNDEYFGFDDALYTALRLLRIIDNIKRKGEDFNSVIDELPAYYSTKEFRDPIPEKLQDKILENLEKYAHQNDGKLITIDGVRGEFAEGWFIARKSGTEEALSYRIEGSTPQQRDKILTDVREIIYQN